MENPKIQKILSLDDYSWKPNKLIMQPELSLDIFVYRMLVNVYVSSMQDIAKGRTVTIDVDHIIKGKLAGSRYQQINSAIDTIMSLQMSLKPEGNKKFQKINIVSKAAFVEETRGTRRNQIQVTINADFIPYLAAFFLEGYTKIPRCISLELKTVPMNKMIELLYRFSGFKKKFIMTISELHYHLGIPEGKYQRWVHLNQKVLTPIHKAICKTGYVNYKYTPIKKGRKVEEILFEIIQIIEDKTAYDPTAESIVNDHIWPAHRPYILDNYPPDYLAYYHKKCHQEAESGNVKNIDSLVFKSIMNDPDCYEEKKKHSRKKDILKTALLKAEEKIRIEEEKKYAFAERCFEAMSQEVQQKYNTSVTSHYCGEEVRKSIAVDNFIRDYEKELMGCKSPEDFIKVCEDRP